MSHPTSQATNATSARPSEKHCDILGTSCTCGPSCSGASCVLMRSCPCRPPEVPSMPTPASQSTNAISAHHSTADCPGPSCTSCPPGRSLADEFAPLNDGTNLNTTSPDTNVTANHCRKYETVRDGSAATTNDPKNWQQPGLSAPELDSQHQYLQSGFVPNQSGIFDHDFSFAKSDSNQAQSWPPVQDAAASALMSVQDAAASALYLGMCPPTDRSKLMDPSRAPVPLTTHAGNPVGTNSGGMHAGSLNPHWLALDSDPHWRNDAVEKAEPFPPNATPQITSSVQALIASSRTASGTAGLDSVAAVAMDLIHTSNWRCMWKHCSGVIDHGDTVQQHILKHVANTLLKAQSCKMDSCSGQHLKPGQNHLSQHLSDLGFQQGTNIRCTWDGTCTRRFASADKYRKHIETHVYVDSSRYDCGWRGCTSHGFTSFHELLNHSLATHMHSTKEQVSTLVATARPLEGSETMCQWEGCRFQGQTVANLQEHVVAAHADWCSELPERVVVCRWGSCRRFFTDKTKFANHMCTHSGMKFFHCAEDGCEHGFTTESQRRAHVRRHHEKSFKCEICASQGVEKGYSSGFNLREHIRSVHDKKPLICKTCGRAYKSHKAWSAHQRSCQAHVPFQDQRIAIMDAGNPY